MASWHEQCLLRALSAGFRDSRNPARHRTHLRKTPNMHRQNRQHLAFVHQFVDSVTVRPFFEDLRRVKQATDLYRSLPLVESWERETDEAA